MCARAYSLSKELQQKDKVIESLRARLNQHQQHHHPHRSDTPCSGHALSDTTDQSDRISYVSDEHGSTIEDLELSSDVDAASELGQEESRISAKVSTGTSVFLCVFFNQHSLEGIPIMNICVIPCKCYSCVRKLQLMIYFQQSINHHFNALQNKRSKSRTAVLPFDLCSINSLS